MKGVSPGLQVDGVLAWNPILGTQMESALVIKGTRHRRISAWIWKVRDGGGGLSREQ